MFKKKKDPPHPQTLGGMYCSRFVGRADSHLRHPFWTILLPLKGSAINFFIYLQERKIVASEQEDKL